MTDDGARRAPDDGARRAPGASAVVAERCLAQLLCGPPARCAVDVVGRLLAVQGQDPRGVRLAIRARSAGLTAADVDRGLTQDRTLLITWLNRGTLHLVRSEDFWWLHKLTTPALLTGNDRRLAQEGIESADEAERAVSVIIAALASDGPLTRAQLADRISAAGIRAQGQALVHLLVRASVRGLIIRGPMVGREHAFVRAIDWLGAPPVRFGRGFDHDVALAELARRYLASHSPADDRDLAKWAGLRLSDARRALNAIAGETSRRVDGRCELEPSRAEAGRDEARSPGLPRPLLLGAFDPLLHGWVDRDPVLGEHKEIVTVNGLFRPFALVEGRAVATWRMAAGKVTLEPFAPLGEPEAAALRAEAADVVRFLG